MKILVAIALFAVLIALCLGLYAVARGGDFAKKYSNKFMRLRVALQAVAIVLILIAVAMKGH